MESNQYESHEILRRRVSSELSAYVGSKIWDLIAEQRSAMYAGAVEPGSLLADEPSVRIDSSQFSTFVEEDERFGHGLALSPLQDWGGRFGMIALYMKIDRQKHRFAEDPIRLSFAYQKSSEAMHNNRPADGGNWFNILKLLKIAKTRNDEPDLYPIDLRTMSVIAKESEGVLRYLASNFGDRSPDLRRREKIEENLEQIFGDSQYLPDGETIAIKTARPGEPQLGMTVEQNDKDYIISIIREEDSMTCKRFIIGPYADNGVDVGYFKGAAEGFEEEDLAAVESLLLDGVQMTPDELMSHQAIASDVLGLAR